MEQVWTGSHVTGSGAAIVVKYRGPTNTRGSRWVASCVRGADETWRAMVPFQDGPIAAAKKLIQARGLNWTLDRVASIDADTYVVTTQ